MAEHAKEFRSLSVVHKARMTPRILLKASDGSETIDVYGWKREDVYDFLRQKLRV